MKQALETLGFGPCHHMYEVMASERKQALWMAADRRPVLPSSEVRIFLALV
jgi:hypothetical protein